MHLLSGEYVTLYQKQRMLLKQRAQEKDNQLLQLSKDKEELKSKLIALDELVQKMLKEKNNDDNSERGNFTILFHQQFLIIYRFTFSTPLSFYLF